MKADIKLLILYSVLSLLSLLICFFISFFGCKIYKLVKTSSRMVGKISKNDKYMLYMILFMILTMAVDFNKNIVLV